ncbi:MAG: CDP-glucose 4,6-dehydratase [Acidimicrobiaceae bacterium]|nr:CDP-glucose 4,6-dehydratase [Acidimicrobiaceae bacterium]
MTGTRPDRLSAILRRSYEGRRVFVTGHNGFVGSWLSFLLAEAGARVTGLSLATEPGSLAEALQIDEFVDSIEGDITVSSSIEDAVADRAPEIVFHLAAQALVLPSYDDPLQTFETNVMGTARVLDVVRRQPSVRSCVIVTSDKCYAAADGAHVETDALGGDDPYSASKAAAEIVAHAYRHSFLGRSDLGLATTRAGNIVGGGDWAHYRIVPDCARAVRGGQAVVLRRPDAVRPWQHVLDAVSGYIRLGDALMREPKSFSQAWNFGPSADAAATVGEFVATLVAKWRELGAAVLEPVLESAPVPERGVLTLDSSKAHAMLGWHPVLDLDATIDWTVEWYAAALRSSGFDARATTAAQVARFLALDHDDPSRSASVGAATNVHGS